MLYPLDELKFAIKQTLEQKLPKEVVKQEKHDRRGIQKDAHAAIAHALWLYDEDLRIRGEFPLEYAYLHHRAFGLIDTVVFCNNHHRGLLLAAEIVTDRVQLGDLYKLRDAPVIDGGARWVIQLNPTVKHTIIQPMALDEYMSDEQMAQIDFIELWRRIYNGLDRRKWARRAKARREAKEAKLRIWEEPAHVPVAY